MCELAGGPHTERLANQTATAQGLAELMSAPAGEDPLPDLIYVELNLSSPS